MQKFPSIDRESNMFCFFFAPVLVQDKQGGRVITVIDNRAALTAARLAGDNKEGLSAMNTLLTGGSSTKK